MKKVLIDVGSSTTKVYQQQGKTLTPLIQRSIPFKDGFSPEEGPATVTKEELLEFVGFIKKKHGTAKITIVATGIFRKLHPQARTAFVDEFFKRTGLFFNIITQDLENFYLEMALVGRCCLHEPVLLINVGGKSTELVVMHEKKAIERKNIDLGVGTIINKFPQINKPLARIEPEIVVAFVKDALPSMSSKVKIAFYTGGELTYMQLANYALDKNTLFEDEKHPYTITTANFTKRNQEVFRKVKLGELEALMPENPRWMHGARACSAIAQAICEKYNLETVIPSDSNTLDGIARQEFRNITISGSFRKHLDSVLEIKKVLEEMGTKVLSPRFTDPKNPGEQFVVFNGEEVYSPLELERYHLEAIQSSDALIVCNPNGYVGASALIEIGYAQALGKRIIFTEPPEEFMLNTLPAEVGVNVLLDDAYTHMPIDSEGPQAPRSA